jgi:hypothetical protein
MQGEGHMTARMRCMVALPLVLALLSACGGDEASVSGDPESHLEARISVGGSPTAIATSPTDVWAVVQGDLIEIDPGRNEPASRVHYGVGSDYDGVAASTDTVWVLNAREGRIVQFDATARKQTASIELPGRPSAVAIGAGSLWIAESNGPQGSLRRLDAESHRITNVAPIGGEPGPIAAEGREVWVATERGGPRLERIDAGRDVAADKVDLPGYAAGIALTSTDAWVSINRKDEGLVVQIDRTTMAAKGRVEIAGGSGAIAYSAGSIWVASNHARAEGFVTRINPERGEALEQISTGATPTGLAGGHGGLWVTNFNDASVVRVNTPPQSE